MPLDYSNFLMSQLDANNLSSSQFSYVTEIHDAWAEYSLELDTDKLEKTIRSDEQLSCLLVFLGVILVHKGKLAEGERLLQEIAELEHNNPLCRAVLMSSALRTLANGQLLSKNEIKAKELYRQANACLKIAGSDILGKNIINAKIRLGLLDDACVDVEKAFLCTLNSAGVNEDIKDKLTILHSEVELIRHEMTIAQQKQQLYKLSSNEDSSLDLADTEAFKKALIAQSPSQLGQDIWALGQHNFKRDGFFVEFGATDGVLLSNTYMLEKLFGWKGLCAEPNPKYFEKLQKNRQCVVANSCISATTGEEVEFIFADEYGGIASYAAADSHANKRSAYANEFGKAVLQTISLHDFLVKHNAPRKVDFLSIDTEGSEFDILNTFPFDQWDIKCITVEHNYSEAREKIYKLLTNNGYERKTVQFDDWYYRD